jgi:hypothetical protein
MFFQGASFESTRRIAFNSYDMSLSRSANSDGLRFSICTIENFVDAQAQMTMRIVSGRLRARNHHQRFETEKMDLLSFAGSKEVEKNPIPKML